MISLGGRSPWALVTSGEGNYDLVSKEGGSRQVLKGDMVWIDGGCSINGYFSDFSRACVIGKASERQKKAQRLIHEITLVGMDMLRPGMPVSQIAARMNQAVLELDLPITSNISGLAGRVGHGIGMCITEPPSLSESDPTILEEGMVVTIEPGVATPFGTFHIEENVLVTKEGPVLLSSPYWELWEIS